jgi:hypothetical protein
MQFFFSQLISILELNLKIKLIFLRHFINFNLNLIK